MVIVGVGPARSVDLPCGDACGSQSSHSQHRLLAATPEAPQHYRLGVARATVRRLVGSLLVAPMVDLESSFGKVHTRNTLAKSVSVLRAEIV